MPKFFTRKRKSVATVSVVVAAIAFFFLSPVFPAFKYQITRTLSLLNDVSDGIGRYFSSKYALSAENRELRARINDLYLEMARFREFRDENDRLRALLDFKRKVGFDTVSAEVIGRNPSDWIDSFIINKGTADGVGVDSAVCSSDGLLGKVVEAGDHTSSVMLVTHPNFRAGGMLKDTRINGVVAGQGAGTVEIIYLPVDSEVQEGMTVITSGFSMIFPKGIPIGKVVSAGKSATGLYRYAVIQPFANSFRQEEVLCIK